MQNISTKDLNLEYMKTLKIHLEDKQLPPVGNRYEQTLHQGKIIQMANKDFISIAIKEI